MYPVPVYSVSLFSALPISPHLTLTPSFATADRKLHKQTLRSDRSLGQQKRVGKSKSVRPWPGDFSTSMSGTPDELWRSVLLFVFWRYLAAWEGRRFHQARKLASLANMVSGRIWSATAIVDFKICQQSVGDLCGKYVFANTVLQRVCNSLTNIYQAQCQHVTAGSKVIEPRDNE